MPGGNVGREIGGSDVRVFLGVRSETKPTRRNYAPSSIIMSYFLLFYCCISFVLSFYIEIDIYINIEILIL